MIHLCGNFTAMFKWMLKIKEKLGFVCEERVTGIIIGTRACWYEHGERSAKYFLNLGKRKHIRNLQGTIL